MKKDQKRDSPIENQYVLNTRTLTEERNKLFLKYKHYAIYYTENLLYKKPNFIIEKFRYRCQILFSNLYKGKGTVRHTDKELVTVAVSPKAFIYEEELILDSNKKLLYINDPNNVIWVEFNKLPDDIKLCEIPDISYEEFEKEVDENFAKCKHIRKLYLKLTHGK